MIKSLRAIIKKGTLYTAAFVLAVSSLSAAVPYMVSETANAVSAPTAMPTVTIGVGILNSSNTVGRNFTVSGNATAGHGLNRVYVQLVNRDTNTRVGGTTINLIGKGGASTWERNYTAADKLPTGTYAAHVEVVDMNGNRSTAGWTANFKLDSTDAAFSMTSPSNGSLVKGVQAVRATITDDSDISKVLMTVHLKTGNKTYVWEAGKANNSLTRSTGDEYSIVLDTSLLNDGANSITLRATDGVGNTRYWNNTAKEHVFSVDNTAPVASISVTPLTGGTTASGIVAITGDVDTAELNMKSHWFEITGPNGNTYYATTIGTVPANSITNSWSFNWDTTAIDNGQYRIRYVATDKADNRSGGNGVMMFVNVNNITPPAVVAPPVGPAAPDNSGAGNPAQAAQTTTGTGSPLTPTTQQQAAPQGVLGAQTDTDSDNAAESEVKGAATKAVAQAASTDKDLKELAGLAWYWWLLIAAAAVALFWWIIAAARRRKNDEE